MSHTGRWKVFGDYVASQRSCAQNSHTDAVHRQVATIALWQFMQTLDIVMQLKQWFRLFRFLVDKPLKKLNVKKLHQRAMCDVVLRVYR